MLQSLKKTQRFSLTFFTDLHQCAKRRHTKGLQKPKEGGVNNSNGCHKPCFCSNFDKWLSIAFQDTKFSMWKLHLATRYLTV